MENDKNQIIQFKSHIEVCEMSEQDLAGRTKIIMTALQICKDETEWNKNGICWLEQYVQDNIDSIIGAPFVTSWADEENQIPYDHGDMTYDDDGNVQFDGVTVGSIQEGYVEDREIDGETKKVLTVKGFLYNQRYGKLIEWIKSEVTDSTVYGSIEINGKGKNKDIQYLNGRTNPDGTLKIGRIPEVFDFSALAILSNLCEPADDSSQVIEVNSKINNIDENNKIVENESIEINESNNLISNSSEDDINKIENNEKGEQTNMNLVKKGQVVEVNNLDVYDIEQLLQKAFLLAIGCISDDCYNYYLSYLYPLNSEFIMTKWNDNGDNQYYKASYSIDISAKTVTLGDIYEVERSWTPIDNEQPIEMNANKKKEKVEENQETSTEVNENKGGNEDMEDKKMIEECNTKISELNTKVTEKDATITELNAKVVELNEAIVNANKTMEELNAKVKTMEEENNSCKTEVNDYKEKYDTLIAEKTVAETNSYFETEIKKNGFEEAEVNSLKDFVSKGDLEGLKKAEAELCAKKFKEMMSKSVDDKTEINSSNGLGNMIAIKEEKIVKSEVEEGKSLFI